MSDEKENRRKSFRFGPFFSVEEIEGILNLIMAQAYNKNRAGRPRLSVFSVKSESDGVPRIERIGSVGERGFNSQIVNQKSLVDVLDNEDEIMVVAELPSVKKEDIELSGTTEVLRISVDTPKRYFYEEVKMPSKVYIEKAKASYKNRVLQVTLPKI